MLSCAYLIVGKYDETVYILLCVFACAYLIVGKYDETMYILLCASFINTTKEEEIQKNFNMIRGMGRWSEYVGSNIIPPGRCVYNVPMSGRLRGPGIWSAGLAFSPSVPGTFLFMSSTSGSTVDPWLLLRH